MLHILQSVYRAKIVVGEHNGSMTSTQTIVLDRMATEQPPAAFSRVEEACDGITVAELRDIAVHVGLEAAALVKNMRESLVDAHGHVRVARVKSSDVDPVTQVDKASEGLIRRRLLEAVPNSRVLGEEEGEDDGELNSADREADSGLLWVVDPIDGTVNFVYGVPAYAVSIAATVDGLPVAGVVIDVANGLVSSAAVGEEATEAVVKDFSRADASSARQGRVLSVDQEADEGGLSKALVATGFAYLAERREKQAELLTQLLPEVRDIRRIGSAAIDLCHIAAGRVDAYYEHGLGPWDHAAGVLIAARAGAIVQMPQLHVQSTAGVQVMAAKPGVWEPLQARLSDLVAGGVVVPVEGS